ncbi:hypothetical protein [Aquibium oceanicum]|uniref:Uncharacterized protein n=1 Tax=Aquibium oceanicum TaxID=1670800 RepID=A0A1L3SWY4_9HYPH|nr:hypothetical protein [Aquibium oceanicum]APH73937.1 hypothetical protein BSQ44_23095 [Aquibium oceanicum]
MGERTPWGHHQRWHELLDAVCIEEGHDDNMALANDLSAVSGNRSGEAFEAALKNLRNWRNGTHLPQRRNFILLTKALHVDSHEGLKKHWTHLYAEARRDAKREPAHSRAVPSMRALPAATMLATIAVPMMIVGAGLVFIMGFEVSAQDGASADVEYRKAVSLKVGESIVVHGARGKCGEEPPVWEKVLPMLPELEIGHWSEGNIGTRYSRKCGGPTPARGIVLNATRSGQAEVTLFGDPVKIEVD